MRKGRYMKNEKFHTKIRNSGEPIDKKNDIRFDIYLDLNYFCICTLWVMILKIVSENHILRDYLLRLTAVKEHISLIAYLSFVPLCFCTWRIIVHTVSLLKTKKQKFTAILWVLVIFVICMTVLDIITLMSLAIG